MRNAFTYTLIMILTVAVASAAGNNDKITEIKLNLYPSEGRIGPNQTVVLHAEFFGTKKKGFFESLLGINESKKTKLQSNDWKIEIVTPNGGVLSKRFLFQQEDQKLKGGWETFVSQGIGAASAKDAVLFTAPAKAGRYKVRLTEGALSREAEIEVVAGLENTLEISFQTQKSDDKYLPLVENYSPFIAQETWFSPKADYIVRFDYDGNWKGDDNWENLETGSSQAFVYYAVMETSTHWFLNFNFFHPRDYSDVCVVGTCHENDYEGLILTVRKDGSKFGKLELMETLAHNNIYSFTNENSIQKDVHDIDGGIAFYKETHPIVFVEAGGHGIMSATHRNSLFDTAKMEFTQNTGVTYKMKNGMPEKPASGNDRNVGYALLSVENEFWSRGAGDMNAPNETFENYFKYQPFGNRPAASAEFIAGAFKGRTASDNKAKPSWAWHGNRARRKRLLNTGQWVLDPAYSVSVCLKFPENLPVSTEYIFNPFLLSTLRTAAIP